MAFPARKLYTGIPRVIVLSFPALHRYCGFLLLLFVFKQTGGLWQPCIEQVHWCHFSNSICLLVCLGHILEILAIFQSLSLSLYLVW